MTEQTIKNVPTADVGKTVQRFANQGAESITCTPQGGGLWTIVIVLP